MIGKRKSRGPHYADLEFPALPPAPKNDPIAQDIAFVQSICDQISKWQSTSFLNNRGYLAESLLAVTQRCEKELEILYRKYGENQYLKNKS